VLALAGLFELEQVDASSFELASPPAWTERLHGGGVIAAVVLAATRTCDDRHGSSLS
jgi:acyl-CoA thioesterase